MNTYLDLVSRWSMQRMKPFSLLMRQLHTMEPIVTMSEHDFCVQNLNNYEHLKDYLEKKN